MTLFLGIDPGTHGAWACIDTHKHELRCGDLPITRSGPNKKPHLDAPALLFVLRAFAPDQAYIEEVFSSPQMGVVSAFTFGENFGACMGVLAALDCPITKTRPSLWKAQLRVPADKKLSRARASELFPRCGDIYWPRAGHDGRAEAAMIALYGALAEGATFTRPLEPVDAPLHQKEFG